MSIFSWFTSTPQRQLSTIQLYEFPAGLRAKFARLHPALSEGQQELVFAGLRDYFYICHQAKKAMVAMPSQVVDDAWHEFILFTREYNDFCTKAFGRYLHHTPAEAMYTTSANMISALDIKPPLTPPAARHGVQLAWRLACRKEGINPAAPAMLPLIFAIDSQLNIENGFHYTLNCLTGNNLKAAGAHQYCATHIGCGGSSCGGSSSSGSCGHGDGGHGGHGCSGHGRGGHGCGGSSCGGGGCGGGGCGGS